MPIVIGDKNYRGKKIGETCIDTKRKSARFINPFQTAFGLSRIVFTDTDYVQIQEKPKVIVSKSNNAYKLLLDTMKSNGYTYLKDEQLGSMFVFEKNGVREEVFFSVNAYFSKWTWIK